MSPPGNALYLGIECGGTRTVAMLADEEGRLVQRVTGGPANLKLLDDTALARHFRALAQSLARPSALAIGMAGARTDRDFSRIRQAAARAWPNVPSYVTNDLETALAAAPRAGSGSIRVLVLSGTGSCCYGISPSGKKVKVGGWGHLLGDKGSGYQIGLRALKAVVYYYDRDGVWPRLGERLLRKLALNEPNELIDWVFRASKPEIGALAVEVFEAWKDEDEIATDIIESAAHSLAKDGAACAKRLAGKGATVEFVFSGSALLKQPKFAKRVSTLLRRLWPKSVVAPLTRESAWGAVVLAMRASARVVSTRLTGSRGGPPSHEQPADLVHLAASPTEQRNPRSMNLDKLSVDEAIALMLSEDARIPGAVLVERKKIAQVVGWIVQAFKRGGRLFYVGAGTSGRLGVLDASECPPTFRASSEMVQGIIAGGQRAVWEAVEGAEDDPAAGANAIIFRGVNRRDVVVGIAASGRTPFVWGALEEASRRRAHTVLLCFNPNLKLQRDYRPDLILAIDVGPEILTGSTRLKSGTATKLILNIFTTLAMVRIGKVLSNLMIDVKASNTKLRDRAVRIVQQLTNCDYDSARRALEKSDWQIKKACARLSP